MHRKAMDRAANRFPSVIQERLIILIVVVETVLAAQHSLYEACVCDFTFLFLRGNIGEPT